MHLPVSVERNPMFPEDGEQFVLAQPCDRIVMTLVDCWSYEIILLADCHYLLDLCR